jgi:hypothetical protein
MRFTYINIKPNTLNKKRELNQIKTREFNPIKTREFNPIKKREFNPIKKREFNLNFNTTETTGSCGSCFSRK